MLDYLYKNKLAIFTFLIFAFSFILFSCTSVQNIVLVDDDIFVNYIDPLPKKDLEKLKFVFKPLNEVTAEKNIVQPDGKGVIIALILREENLTFFESETSSSINDTKETQPNYTKYLIEEKVLVPSIEYNPQNKNALSTLDPRLALSLTSPEKMPEGFRALPLNNSYAGEENYPLSVKTFASCNVLTQKFKKPLLEFCEKIFSAEKTRGEKSDKNKKEKAQNTKNGTVFVSAVGDLMLGRGVEKILLNDINGVEKIFTSTLPILQNNDIMIGNLEGALTERTKALAKRYTFKFSKEVLEPLKNAGFNYLMLTNNHCYDYGLEGFIDTLDALAKYSVPTSGAGKTKEEAKRFYRVEKKGQGFSIISCGFYPLEQSGFNGKKTATATDSRPGILWADDELLQLVADEKKTGNFVIVNVHGGTEYSFSPNSAQREFYKSLCEMGADLIFGSHPHVLQPTEWYGNKLIVYSLGNFIFPGMDNYYGATDSEIMRLGIYKNRILYIEKYPAKIKNTSVFLNLPK